MTSTETAARPAYRPYRVIASRIERLSPHYVRVTFTGDELMHFGTAGLDQRIKVVFPHADGSFSDFGQDEAAGDWYDRWRALPTEHRNVFRTYTVRRVNPEAGSVIVDFVVHHDAGPAGEWAASAALGDELILVGPDSRSEHSAGGIDWHPGTANRVLLVGDETAAPAICGILESLTGQYEVDAFIEVPTADDRLSPDVPESFRVRWLNRDDAEHGTRLIEAVTAWTQQSTKMLERAAAPRPQELEEIDVDLELLWDSPQDAEGEFYAWIAGESATIKQLRRLLVSGCGVDRKRVAFMGYWRLGQSERTE
jgi:NADPH-dependent ferric siderophore reductase